MNILDILMFANSLIPVNSEVNRKQYCVESCKEGVQERFGEHCYLWSTGHVWWHSAKLTCERVNGSLAAVTSIRAG